MVLTGAIVYRHCCDKVGKGEWARKLGAINKVVMKAQSRMVMRGEIMRSVRNKGGEREGWEEKHKEDTRPTCTYAFVNPFALMAHESGVY